MGNLLALTYDLIIVVISADKAITIAMIIQVIQQKIVLVFVVINLGIY